MYVYAFMLRCRHCYAAPFSAEGFGRTLIREVATEKARCVSSQTVPTQQFPHRPLNGDSPVETQNFASHGEVSTRKDNHNVLTVGAIVARETQNLASHEGGKRKEG